jgi:hypothetical protein
MEEVSIDNAAGFVTLTVLLAELDGFSTLVAVITIDPLFAFAGTVNSPEVEIVPAVDDQFTAELLVP